MKPLVISNHYKSLRLVFCLLVVFFSLSMNIQAEQTAEQQQADKAQAQKQLAQLKKQINTLKKRLKSTQRKQSKAQKSLQKTEKKIATTSKILRATSRQLKSKNKSLSSLQKKQSTLKNKKKSQKLALADQIRAAYINGDEEYLKLLLNQEDPETFGRMMVYYDYLNKARTKEVAALQKTLVELRDTKEKITSEIRSLEILKKAKQEESERLDKLKISRLSIVKKLAKEIQSKSDQLTEKQINAQELQQLIDSVSQAIKEIAASQSLSGLKSLRGKLNWPLRGKLLRRYGSAGAGGLKSNGVLIAAKEGAEVDAIHSGRVVYADWLRGFGLLVILDHGKGYMSLYGYNQAIYKEVGDWVEAGEPIASVGQSGGQQRDALYFEMRKEGKPFNPKRWMRR